MKYLFERLVQPQEGEDAAFDVKRAVRENVQRLAANRAFADAEGEPDVLSCGLPSVVDLPRDSRPALESYCAQVRRLVAHYEPRLAEPSVDIEPADGVSPFSVVLRAKLATGDAGEDMRFPVLTHGHG